MTVKLNSIISAPWNARGEITPESVATLAASIKEQGLISPITLWQNADGKWVCIAGNRRLAALRSLDRVELPEGIDCVIFEGDEAEARAITITENLQREDIGPVEEADAVAALLDQGRSEDWIAARLGQSRGWVKRRRKLLALDKAWADEAAHISAACLERVACYPAAVQKCCAWMAERTHEWADCRHAFERECRNLDDANTTAFDTAPCHKCFDRTGQDADLFGVADGKLGCCLNGECYQAKCEAHVAALIAEATAGAEEVNRVRYEWELPKDGDASTKRTKKHPAAWVYWDGYNHELKVVWSLTKAAIDEREEREAAERNAQDAARREKRDRLDSIELRLSEVFGRLNEESDAVKGEVRKLVAPALLDAPAADYIERAVCRELCGYHDVDEWCEILRTFDFASTIANITAEEREEFLAEYGADEDEGGEVDEVDAEEAIIEEE